MRAKRVKENKLARENLLENNVAESTATPKEA
jgi:hypothetical protein